MNTLAENLDQLVADLDDVQAAIIEQGVDVPYGTPTSEYGPKVRQIISGGEWDGELPPGWEEEQFGEALEDIAQYDPILWQHLGTAEVPFYGEQQLATTGGLVKGIALSANGSRMVSIRQNAPYVLICDRVSGGRYTPAAVQPSFDVSTYTSCAISSDGDQFFITLTNNPYFRAFKWDGAQYLNIIPDVPASSGADGLSLSPNGKLLLVKYDRSPWLSPYRVGVNSLVRLATPAGLPGASPSLLTFNPDGSVVVIGNGAEISLYRVVNDTLSDAPFVTITAPSNIRRAAWSPDGLHLALGRASANVTPIYMYKFENDTLTGLPNVSLPSSLLNNDIAWIGDRIFMANGGSTLMWGRVENGALTYFTSPPPLYPDITATGGGQIVARSFDQSTLVWGNNSLVVFATTPRDAVAVIDDVREMQSGDIGFAKEAALKGQQCRINVFPILRGE